MQGMLRWHLSYKGFGSLNRQPYCMKMERVCRKNALLDEIG